MNKKYNKAEIKKIMHYLENPNHPKYNTKERKESLYRAKISVGLELINIKLDYLLGETNG